MTTRAPSPQQETKDSTQEPDTTCLPRAWRALPKGPANRPCFTSGSLRAGSHPRTKLPLHPTLPPGFWVSVLRRPQLLSPRGQGEWGRPRGWGRVRGAGGGVSAGGACPRGGRGVGGAGRVRGGGGRRPRGRGSWWGGRGAAGPRGPAVLGPRVWPLNLHQELHVCVLASGRAAACAPH